MSKWTQFMDMSSGGSRKEDKQYIYIEAPEEEAISIFYNRFGHNPNDVTCTCCGPDYSITDGDDLYQVTGYERGCEYDKENDKYIEEKGEGRFYYTDYVTLEEYIKNSKDTLFIYKEDIKEEERTMFYPYTYI